MKYYLAIDIGASGGRHILGHLEDGIIKLEEVWRFENGPVPKNGQLCWDSGELFEQITSGLRRCRELGKIPESIGIDTWGVDFVLLDDSGKVIGDSVAYRDSRTAGMDKILEQKISYADLYERTGIQKQPFNTIYQLAAVQQNTPEQLEQAHTLLMLPDYFSYLLTGVPMCEYAIASTSGLVNVRDKVWDTELLELLGYPKDLFLPLVEPGTTAGRLKPEIQKLVGFDAEVVRPPSHDTASAFVAVPASSENSVYLSSGTWSLLGVEAAEPITSATCRDAGFTNEGGYLYRYRLLKNIMGQWMIQTVRRELGKKHSYDDLMDMAHSEESFGSRVNVNDLRFLQPDSMMETVKLICAETGQAVPANLGQILQCIYASLADSYAQSIQSLQTITGKTFDRIHIVGGGCKNPYLNELTARAAGLPVYAGPVEGTSLGNLAVQMIRGGELSGLEGARQAIRDSFAIEIVKP